LIGHELDAIPLVIIRDYVVSRRLTLATNPPFAEPSVAELERGLRVDRFLAMDVRWLLLEDSTALASSTPLCGGTLSPSRQGTSNC
jgi:hypothetical protein